MWETIKNDPILRTVTIIILGVLGFGFAFNIMFGPRNGYGMGMENGEGMSGRVYYSYNDTLSYIFIIAFKLLMIALVITALVYLFRLGIKYLSPGGEPQLLESIKKDPLLKSITVIALLLAVIGLISILFKDLLGNNNSMSYGYGMYAYNQPNPSISGIVTSLFEILLFLSVIGFVIGLVVYVKQNYSKDIVNRLSLLKTGQNTETFCPYCGFAVAEESRFCPGCGARLMIECPECGEEIKAEWKCCPNCGTDIFRSDSIVDKVDQSDLT